jgi:hypothetical protein
VFWEGGEVIRVAELSEQSAAFNFLPNEGNAYRNCILAIHNFDGWNRRLGNF